MLRVLIADDEKPARARLRRLLEPFHDVEIVGEAENGLSALEELARRSPDVVFLDIEMPELDGLGVARSLGIEGPSIVFVTAYDEYALKAFEAGAVDYLVKPISDGRLGAALTKIRQRRGPATGLPEVLKRLQGSSDARFAVRSGSKFVVCDPRKISAIVARDHYAAILTEGRELLADDPLDALQARLDPDRFLRVHRGAVINLDYLRELEREGDRKYVALLSSPAAYRIPVSRERLDDLKARLGI